MLSCVAPTRYRSTLVVKRTPLLSAYSLVSAYTLPAFNPFFIKRIRVSRNLHVLRVELKLSRKLQENRLLQPTGDAMGTGGAIIKAELIATGEAEVQSIQTMLDGGIVASRNGRFVAGRLASSAGSPLCLLAV